MLRLPALRLASAITAGLLLVATPPSVVAQEVLDGIAAVVNDAVITFSQVRELVGAQEKAARETLKGEELVEKVKEIRLRAINDLIDRELILQEFKSKGFTIPDHFLEERISTIIREEFGGDRSAFVRTLAAQGYTLERFRQLEREKMIVQAMRSQNVKSDVLVPEPKVVAYYQKNTAAYSEEEQIKLRMITIRKSEGSDSRRKMMEEIRQKIVEGAEFQDLARMYSEDSTQEAGGDWGWITRKTLNEELTKIAFSLKAGEVSKIIELGNSYYLLQVEAKKNATTKPLTEVRAEIEKKLIQEERQRTMQEWTAKLRKKAYIKLY
ncbi:MAG TPA: peptidyl-prolyl cis-trans isomerase [Chthoniobacteraceae bacterium]|jgi:peptidyl-prolyl cis-trans isomerase SurA